MRWFLFIVLGFSVQANAKSSFTFICRTADKADCAKDFDRQIVDKSGQDLGENTATLCHVTAATAKDCKPMSSGAWLCKVSDSSCSEFAEDGVLEKEATCQTKNKNQPLSLVYVKVKAKRYDPLRIPPAYTEDHVKAVFCAPLATGAAQAGGKATTAQ